MTYTILGQDLHETADCAKKWFSQNYAATHFKCEQSIVDGLPLKPTWQARLRTQYMLCVNVQPAPFSPTISDFVRECAQRGNPIKLWVVVPQGPARDFSRHLKSARNAGVGVVQIADDGTVHEYHRPVPLSLYALRRTDMKKIPKVRVEDMKNAEATFLDGAPPQGCQVICQELEDVTRAFAERTYNDGLWKSPSRARKHNSRFFRTGPWGKMLEALDSRVDVTRVRKKSPSFNRAKVAGARAYTDWRNVLSHRPKTTRQLQHRDTRLRTMFEATRDLLIEWYAIAKPFKLVK